MGTLIYVYRVRVWTNLLVDSLNGVWSERAMNCHTFLSILVTPASAILETNGVLRVLWTFNQR